MRFIPFIIIVIVGIAGAVFFYQRSQEQQRAAYVEQRKAQEWAERGRAYSVNLPRINISDWKGKTTAEMAALFPTARGLDSVGKDSQYDDCEVKNWKGWQKVVLSFDKKRLNGVAFEAAVLLAEDDMARIATEKFGVVLPKANYVREGSDRGYDGLAGNVSSVMFFGDLVDDKKVASFVLFAESQQSSGIRSINFKFSELAPAAPASDSIQ